MVRPWSFICSFYPAISYFSGFVVLEDWYRYLWRENHKISFFCTRLWKDAHHVLLFSHLWDPDLSTVVSENFHNFLHTPKIHTWVRGAWCCRNWLTMDPFNACRRWQNMFFYSVASSKYRNIGQVPMMRQKNEGGGWSKGIEMVRGEFQIADNTLQNLGVRAGLLPTFTHLVIVWWRPLYTLYNPPPAPKLIKTCLWSLHLTSVKSLLHLSSTNAC